ncbi:hypothetical protein ALO36_103438 [Pseudomonas syringae pv. tomato]|nr:Unknown protein sequence [Pseudomonas syringae pv. maculicola]KPC12496.1 Unknown protein sequence [Pseudomonas syringae pv. maculicola str. M6]KPY90531.1 hypothetical protein ALO36_103438 [Pseudomonas syringae pv. tomato]
MTHEEPTSRWVFCFWLEFISNFEGIRFFRISSSIKFQIFYD